MIVAGALVTLLASVCFNLNNLLEKRAVDTMSALSIRRPVRMVRSLAASRVWMTGFVIGIVAIGLLVVSYSLAPTIVVQSIFGAGVVILVVASRRYLGEHLGRREHVGIGLIVVALVFVSVTLRSESSAVTTSPVLAVVVVSAVATVVAGVALWRLQSLRVDLSVSFGVTSGLLYGVASLQTKAASTVLERHGDLGGIPWLFESPYPYIFVLTSLLGLVAFQSGLQRCRLAVLSPMTSTVASVFVVVAGSTVFRDPFPHDAVLVSLRLFGFVLVLLGSWLLATSSAGALHPGSAATNVQPDA